MQRACVRVWGAVGVGGGGVEVLFKSQKVASLLAILFPRLFSGALLVVPVLYRYFSAAWSQFQN